MDQKSKFKSQKSKVLFLEVKIQKPKIKKPGLSAIRMFRTKLTNQAFLKPKAKSQKCPVAGRLIRIIRKEQVVKPGVFDF